MIQARIDELKALAAVPFNTILDVDAVTTNRVTGKEDKETRSFIPMDHAVALREGLEEAMKGLEHYRDALKARIVSDSAFSASDLGKIDGNGANHAH